MYAHGSFLNLVFRLLKKKSQRFFLDAELKSMVCDSNDEENSDSDVDISSQKQVQTNLR